MYNYQGRYPDKTVVELHSEEVGRYPGVVGDSLADGAPDDLLSIWAG